MLPPGLEGRGPGNRNTLWTPLGEKAITSVSVNLSLAPNTPPPTFLLFEVIVRADKRHTSRVSLVSDRYRYASLALECLPLDLVCCMCVLIVLWAINWLWQIALSTFPGNTLHFHHSGLYTERKLALVYDRIDASCLPWCDSNEWI